MGFNNGDRVTYKHNNPNVDDPRNGQTAIVGDPHDWFGDGYSIEFEEPDEDGTHDGIAFLSELTLVEANYAEPSVPVSADQDRAEAATDAPEALPMIEAGTKADYFNVDTEEHIKPGGIGPDPLNGKTVTVTGFDFFASLMYGQEMYSAEFEEVEVDGEKYTEATLRRSDLTPIPADALV